MLEKDTATTVHRAVASVSLHTMDIPLRRPAVLVVFSQGMQRGTSAGLRASAGVLTMNLVFFTLSATGVSAVLLTSIEIFLVIKWLGAIYLVWIGLMLVLRRHEGKLVTAKKISPQRSFLQGLITQGANPKALIFFAALLPQFVDTSAPLGQQIIILAITSVTVETIVLASYASLASFSRRSTQSKSFQPVAGLLSGTLLIGAGIGLAMIRRA